MSSQQPGTAEADLLWHIRLARQQAEQEIAERDQAHEAELTRLLTVAVETLGDLEGLLAQADADADRYRRSAEVIARKLTAALGQARVTLVGTVGEDLDPAIHHVIGTEETPESPPDQVTQVLKHGYQYRGRIVPADVVVSANPVVATGGQPAGNQPNTNEGQE
jgi:molecular chaperone GrpE (heat shock protein)